MTIYIVLSPKSYVLAWLMPDFRLKMVVSCAQMARVLPFRLLFCLPDSAYSQLTFCAECSRYSYILHSYVASLYGPSHILPAWHQT